MKERKQKRDRFPPRVFGVRGFDHSNQRGRARWDSNNNSDNTNNDNGGPSRDPGRQSAQGPGRWSNFRGTNTRGRGYGTRGRGGDGRPGAGYSGIQCYNCRELGHIARDCKKRSVQEGRTLDSKNESGRRLIPQAPAQK